MFLLILLGLQARVCVRRSAALFQVIVNAWVRFIATVGAWDRRRPPRKAAATGVCPFPVWEWVRHGEEPTAKSRRLGSKNEKSAGVTRRLSRFDAIPIILRI